MKISSETSRKISNIGLLCALMVVCIHTPWPLKMPSLAIVHFLRRGIGQMAVPFFFAVSGVFLAAHFKESDWYKRELAKRVRTLLLPYVF